MVQFTISEEELALLESVTELMRHRNPSGDPRVVMVRALEELHSQLEKERLGKTSRPQNETTRTAKPDHVTQATRREVLQRDGERCSYVSAQGKRCESRSFLEIDHVHPRALGGTSEPDNLRPICAAHNRWLAEQKFGKKHVEGKIRARRARRERPRAAERTVSDSSRIALVDGTPPTPVELVSSALVKLGFRQADARRALDVVMSRPETDPAKSFDSVFRAALAVLT